MRGYDAGGILAKVAESQDPVDLLPSPGRGESTRAFAFPHRTVAKVRHAGRVACRAVYAVVKGSVSE